MFIRLTGLHVHVDLICIIIHPLCHLTVRPAGLGRRDVQIDDDFHDHYSILIFLPYVVDLE